MCGHCGEDDVYRRSWAWMGGSWTEWVEKVERPDEEEDEDSNEGSAMAGLRAEHVEERRGL